jgi:trans-2-enoyl-CoA reductase
LLNNLGGDINIRDDWLNSANCREMIAELPPIKLALNCVGGEVATDMARVLGHGGTMVTYGSMSKKPLVVPHDLLTTKALSLRGFWMADWYKKHSAAERTAMINEIATMIRNDKLSFLFSLHDFDDFDYALKTALEPFNFRKIVLNMDYPDRLAEHDARPKEDYNVFTSPAV